MKLQKALVLQRFLAVATPADYGQECRHTPKIHTIRG